MAITQKNVYGVGDVNFTTLMDTTDKTRIGLHACSLTNYDNTSIPALSAGSAFECNGTMYYSDTETSIGGSPADGTVYIKVVPAGATATLLFTDTAPVWDAVKQGWYSPTGGESSYRYLEFRLIKTAANYAKFILPKYMQKVFCTANCSMSRTLRPAGVTQTLAKFLDPFSMIDVPNKRIIIPKTGYYNTSFNISVGTKATLDANQGNTYVAAVLAGGATAPEYLYSLNTTSFNNGADEYAGFTNWGHSSGSKIFYLASGSFVWLVIAVTTPGAYDFSSLYGSLSVQEL